MLVFITCARSHRVLSRTLLKTTVTTNRVFFSWLRLGLWEGLRTTVSMIALRTAETISLLHLIWQIKSKHFKLCDKQKYVFCLSKLSSGEQNWLKREFALFSLDSYHYGSINFLLKLVSFCGLAAESFSTQKNPCIHRCNSNFEPINS